MKQSLARFALVLGLLSAIGPIAIDMYLPALPTLAADLGTDVGGAQMSLVAFFLALAGGQWIYGPLSDMVGRKPPLYFGLGLFVAAGIGCIFAPTIGALVALRFVQGIGISAVATIVRATVRDLHTGPEAARLISLSLIVLGVSPVLAPLAGSGVILVADWHAIFAVLVATGLIGLAVVFFMLPETLPKERRNPHGLGAAFRDYALLLRDRRFLALTAITGFAQGGFFSYLAGSAFFFIGVYGLEPWVYSVVFALNAIGMIGLMQFNAPLMRRFGAERQIVIATFVNMATTAILLALTLAGLAPLPVALAFLFVSVCTFAFIAAPGSVLAIDPHGTRAGTASALMGTLQFACGAIGSGLVSAFFDGGTPSTEKS